MSVCVYKKGKRENNNANEPMYPYSVHIESMNRVYALISPSHSLFLVWCMCVRFLLFFCVQWIESIKRGTHCMEREREARV